MSSDDHRRAELVSTLGAVRARIADACAHSGRDPRDVTLIAVTKTRPVSDIRALADLGVLDIGESKDQEARRKLAEIADAGGDLERLRWHMVGRLQTNKARSVVSYADAVHSVDRMKLARALADAAHDARDTPLDVFVQVSLDGNPGRGGVAIADLLPLAGVVAERERLRLRGVMTVPPMDLDAGVAFERLAELSHQLRAQFPSADAISAGMSADLEAAVRAGATHVRVGTALLGRRDPSFG